MTEVLEGPAGNAPRSGAGRFEPTEDSLPLANRASPNTQAYGGTCFGITCLEEAFKDHVQGNRTPAWDLMADNQQFRDLVTAAKEEGWTTLRQATSADPHYMELAQVAAGKMQVSQTGRRSPTSAAEISRQLAENGHAMVLFSGHAVTAYGEPSRVQVQAQDGRVATGTFIPIADSNVGHELRAGTQRDMGLVQLDGSGQWTIVGRSAGHLSTLYQGGGYSIPSGVHLAPGNTYETARSSGRLPRDGFIWQR